jgi:inner membrane transporter RhtA
VASTDAPSLGGMLARAPSPLLVLGGIGSVQFGSAIASTLFARIGPGGAVLLRLVSASLVLLAAMNLSFYEAIQRIPLGIGVTIEFIGPLAVAVAGTRKRLDLAWAALAAVGILALMHGEARGVDALGAGLSLAMCVASVAVLPAGVIEGGAQLATPHSLAVGAAVGMLSSAIPYSLEMEALRRIATGLFGMLMSLEPAVAALAGFLVLGQNLSGRELIGIALVVIASVGASRRARQAPIAV